MTQPSRRCSVTWCRSLTHDDETSHIAHHFNQLGQFAAETATVEVVARWGERRDGRPSVDPHVSIFTTTPGEPQSVIDLTPREARLWAGQLEVLNATPWLAGKLLEGADLLHEWEHDEYAGVRHQVAENPGDHRSAMLMVNAAVDMSRDALAGFERIPPAAIEALGLKSWIDKYRDVVTLLIQSVEAMEAEGDSA